MNQEQLFSPEELVNELKTESRALNLPEGSIEYIIAHILHAVTKWLSKREIVTKSDLERVVARELDQYSPDLAYVYKNRGKII